MLSGHETWSLVSLALAAFALGLGLFVLHANPRADATRAFFLVMILLFVGGCTDFFFMNAADQAQATALARLLLFVLVLEMGALLYLATFLPYESSSGWFRDRWWLYFLVVSATALAPALLLQEDDVAHTSYGWGVEGSLALWICGALILLYTLAADAMLADVYRRTSDKNSRTRIVIVAVATTTPIVYTIIYAILDQTTLDLPPILSPGFFIAAVIMAHAVRRYRLFTIKVQDNGKSAVSSSLAARRFEYGTSLLFLEKKGERAFAAFENEVAAGSVGVVISSDHPDVLRERYRLQNSAVIWLAKQPGEKRVDPASLSILQVSIADFLHQHEGAVVLVDGVECLLANNSLENVLKMLYALDDEVVVTKGLLITTLDPEVMSKKGLAMLVRDFQVVEGKGAGTEI
ncbi:MAG: DUF835 domain-containing protein [Methanomassiliicoccales archaeon]|nr:DUF835 domain-containing protein [Methanomassiliicoccales archaeon]MDD1756694.1 DUF835 domain-containing protein [Methanomassiliicoccales archaeon]